MVTKNRLTTRARDAQVIAGIQKHLSSTSTVPLQGTTYTPADLVELFQSRIASAAAVTGANASWRATVVADRALDTKLTPLLRELRQYALSVFGETSPVLADFGFAPPKRATRTPEEKAAAAAKARATRAARHTAGKNQKKAVKGDVTGIVVTPITAAGPVSGGSPPHAAGGAGATPPSALHA